MPKENSKYKICTMHILKTYTKEKGFIMNEKKIVNYTFRVDKDLKDRFVEVCKANDTDSSKELRKFIKQYLSKHAQLTMQF